MILVALVVLLPAAPAGAADAESIATYDTKIEVRAA